MSSQTLTSEMETASEKSEELSGIYWGNVRHRRFGDITHEFSYQLYMMGLDLDELPQTTARSALFGTRWYNPIRFVESDYLAEKEENVTNGEPKSLKQRIASKVQQLGGVWSESNRVTMLAQCRCLGIYFSPINCFFCYDETGNCRYMLAEVSNTPWRQRHYYLIDMHQELKVKKEFHVSPFMDLNMTYFWKIQPPAKRTLVHIESRREEKLFDATLALTKQSVSKTNIRKTVLKIPAMTIKVVMGIYYQALKLFLKKVPFVTHPDSAS
ncbi:DUF1365 domain-containing protein [Vibrio splendidus]|uniref:DUF1365 domain-containing protein n=1 Tax=Vibrio splendidus TaxID=29497 RepID=UPI000C85A770|nr:DUF1365 domain-containing protein [Vibrio splendidus]PMK14810.1 chromosome partitioning protein ParA [Vibrio splendidus]